MIDWQLAAAIPRSAGGVAYFAFAEEVDALPAGISASLAQAQGFVAKPGTTMFANEGDRLIVIVGLGARPSADGDEGLGAEIGAASKRWLGAGASVARSLRSTPEVAIVLTPGLSQSAHGQVVEGFELGAYEFAVHRSASVTDSSTPTTELVHVIGIERPVMDRAINVARSVNFARDLANETPNRMTATHLVAIAREIAADSLLSFALADKDALMAGGFGCLLAVNAGSVEPPAMITLGYSPSESTDSTPHVVLVGKGITFDSGGLSLKQPAHMYDMKGDMGGAAAVFAVVRVARALAFGVRVTAIVAATDNLPGPNATKPGEVVTARNGTTVEILDTDAEGRLVLADALSYATELEPAAIIDVATLTGYTRTIGSSYSVVHSNNVALRERVLRAAGATGEYVWAAPWAEHYRSYIDSSVADLRNIGDPDEGDPVLAAQFLHEFTADTPWCHLDIGDSGFSSKANGEINKGCTGAMVRTLIELVNNWPH